MWCWCCILTEASLASDTFFFATVVAVKRGVGGARFRGELLFHANIFGTAPVLGLTFPLRPICRSSSLKCLEQTWVPLFMEKLGPTSLLIAWIHCFFRFSSFGKRKNEFFLPIWLSRLSFLVQRGTQQFVGISQHHDGILSIGFENKKQASKSLWNGSSCSQLNETDSIAILIVLNSWSEVTHTTHLTKIWKTTLYQRSFASLLVKDCVSGNFTTI